MLALVLGLAAALLIAVWLLPRPVQWKRLSPLLTALGILTAFALGSWLIGVLASGGWLSSGPRSDSNWPPGIVIVAAVLFVGMILYRRSTNRLSLLDPAETVLDASYRDDSHWYSSQWRQHPKNADVDLGTAGYRLELVDGPLAGRTARLRDSRFRLWVASAASGGELIVRGAIECPALQGVWLLGSYGFSHGEEAMVWTPATRPSVGSSLS